MPKKYKYYFPEQRELSKNLKNGDTALLSDWTGYARSTISMMCHGSRRMADIVKVLINKIYDQRADIEKYLQQSKRTNCEVE